MKKFIFFLFLISISNVYKVNAQRSDLGFPEEPNILGRSLVASGDRVEYDSRHRNWHNCEMAWYWDSKYFSWVKGEDDVIKNRWATFDVKQIDEPVVVSRIRCQFYEKKPKIWDELYYYIDVKIQKPYAFTSYPAFIPWGSSSSYTFSATKFTHPDTRYEWKVPIGWKINGGSNTLLTSSNSVQITAANTNDDGKVQVRIKCRDAYTDWITCPYQGVKMPEIIFNSQNIYQHELATFSISPGVEAMYGWPVSVNGSFKIIHENGIHKLLPLKTGSLTLSIDIRPTGWSSYKPSKTINVLPTRIKINGESNVSGNTLYKIENLPSGASVTWSVGSALRIVSSTNTSVTVSPKSYTSSTPLKATVNYQGATFEITKNVSCDWNLVEVSDFYSNYKRYKIDNLVPGAVVIWSASSGINLTLPESGAVEFGVCGQRSPWLKATVNLNGVLSSKQVNIKPVNLTGMEHEILMEDVVYKDRVHYAFFIDPLPLDLPLEGLEFCWSISVERGYRLPTGVSAASLIHTGGNTGMCVMTAPWPGGGGTLSPAKVQSSSAQEEGLIERSGGVAPIYPPVNPPVYPPVPIWPVDPLTAFPVNRPDYAVIKLPETPFRGTLTCKVHNKCGHYFTQTFQLDNTWYLDSYSVSNPVSSTLVVSKGETTGQARSLAGLNIESVSVQLYSSFGLLKTVEADTSYSSIEMDTSDLPDGTYYLNIVKAGEVIDRQVILVKH